MLRSRTNSDGADLPVELLPGVILPASQSAARRILSSSEAAAAVRRGIVRAARDCELWGGDWPTDRGCENLLQVRAAEELHLMLCGHGLGWVTLEEPVASVSCEGTRRRGRRFASMSDQ